MNVAYFGLGCVIVVGELFRVVDLVFIVLMVLSSIFMLYLLFIKVCFVVSYSFSLFMLLSGYVISQ